MECIWCATSLREKEGISLTFPGISNHDLQLVEGNLFRFKGASQGLALLAAAQTPAWTEEVRKQSWSPSYGQKCPDDRAEFWYSGRPARRVRSLASNIGRSAPRSGSVLAHRLMRKIRRSAHTATNRQRESIRSFSATRKKTWNKKPLSSDAEFVCWKRTPDSDHQRLILCNGSYAAVEHGPALRFKRKFLGVSCVLSENQRKIFSSDMEAVEAELVSSDRQAPVARISGRRANRLLCAESVASSFPNRDWRVKGDVLAAHESPHRASRSGR